MLRLLLHALLIIRPVKNRGLIDASGGMMVIKAESLEEAERYAHADPSVQKSLLQVSVKQWMLPCALFNRNKQLI